MSMIGPGTYRMDHEGEDAGERHARRAALRDAVYGLAVGDALGVPYEFRERGGFECTGMAGGGAHGKPAGTWSDDTSMTLAIRDAKDPSLYTVVLEDTTAAVAGALAGIAYGAHSIPAEWLGALRGRDLIDGVLFERSSAGRHRR